MNQQITLPHKNNDMLGFQRVFSGQEQNDEKVIIMKWNNYIDIAHTKHLAMIRASGKLISMFYSHIKTLLQLGFKLFFQDRVMKK